MLLGAARYLAETGNFDGTVHFIFQPAEENVAGGGVMVAEGLFEKFPMTAVYGMHNRPNLPLGEFAMRPGPALASADNFGIVIHGRGTHAAWPHLGIDVVAVAAQTITALQNIVSRQTSPLDCAVVSVTSVHGGSTDNVIPDEIRLRGTARSFLPHVQDRIEVEPAPDRCVQRRRCSAPPRKSNTNAAIRRCTTIPNASRLAPRSRARSSARIMSTPITSRAWAPTISRSCRTACRAAMSGSAPGRSRPGRFLHNPRYDFNDGILPIGASYWARLVESQLPRKA